jgi:hypothetical protein
VSGGERDDGGPAFPHTLPGHQIERGMSLRDHFAGMAMQGELAAMCDGDVPGVPMDIKDDTIDRLARHWYRIADAMLKARAA